MRQFAIRLTGINGIIMHFDNLEWRDAMEKWNKDPENKRNSKAGDDRTPAWRWLGCLYHDGKLIGIPSDNLMTCFREGGAKVPTGKGQGTFKKQSQSGIMVNEILWPIIVNKAVLPVRDILALRDEEDFGVHQDTAKAHGFSLFVKSVKVGQAKHIRVRPRFDTWEAEGTVSVFDDTITDDTLARIMDNAGRYCGLFDWRPSASKSPGPWGTFSASVKAIK